MICSISKTRTTLPDSIPDDDEATPSSSSGRFLSFDAAAPVDPKASGMARVLFSSVRELGSVLVAYSGGIDSTLLAFIAAKALPGKMLAVLADSPLLSYGERESALETAACCGFPVMVIEHPGFNTPELKNNVVGRCYHCKHALFKRLLELAGDRGLAYVACGENADDLYETRPGEKAISEMGIATPLADCGYHKSEIRAMARSLELPNADLPSSPCLATRFPGGCELTSALLDQVRSAEQLIKDAIHPTILRVRSDGQSHAIVQLDDETLRELDDSMRDQIRNIAVDLGFIETSIASYRRS